MKAGRFSLVLRLAASVVLLALIVPRLDWQELARQVSRLDLRWLLPAALLSPLCLVLLTVRWRLFLRSRGLHPPFAGLLRVLWTGQFLNTFLPGAVGGDVYKAVAVGRLLPQAAWTAGGTVVLDRFCALVALVLLAAAGLRSQGEWLRGVLAGAVAVPAWLGVVSGILGALAAGSAAWLAWTARGRAVWSGRVGPVLKDLGAGLRDSRTVGLALLLSLAIHLANFGVFFALGRSLGLALAFDQVLLVMPAVLLAAMLPISINGHGVREIILVGFFGWQGLTLAGQADPVTAAVAVSLLFVANDLLWNLPGGLWLALAKSAPASPPT